MNAIEFEERLLKNGFKSVGYNDEMCENKTYIDPCEIDIDCFVLLLDDKFYHVYFDKLDEWCVKLGI